MLIIPSDHYKLNKFVIELFDEYIRKNFVENWRYVEVEITRKIGPSYVIVKSRQVKVAFQHGNFEQIRINDFELARCLSKIEKRSRSEHILIHISFDGSVEIEELTKSKKLPSGPRI